MKMAGQHGAYRARAGREKEEEKEKDAKRGQASSGHQAGRHLCQQFSVLT